MTMIMMMIPIMIITMIMTIIVIMAMIIVMIVIVTVIMIMIVKTIMIMIEQNSVQGGHYAKGLIYHRPIFQLPKLAFLSARPIQRENIFYNDGDNDSNSDNDNDDDSDNGNGNDSDNKQFSLSEQPLITAFGKLSYGKRDLVKAEGPLITAFGKLSYGKRDLVKAEGPLITAFGKLSYGKRDFAKAEGRKTENGEGYTRRRRGGGRVKNITRLRTALLLDKRYCLNGQKNFPRDSPT